MFDTYCGWSTKHKILSDAFRCPFRCRPLRIPQIALFWGPDGNLSDTFPMHSDACPVHKQNEQVVSDAFRCHTITWMSTKVSDAIYNERFPPSTQKTPCAVKRWPECAHIGTCGNFQTRRPTYEAVVYYVYGTSKFDKNWTLFKGFKFQTFGLPMGNFSHQPGEATCGLIKLIKLWARSLRPADHVKDQAGCFRFRERSLSMLRRKDSTSSSLCGTSFWEWWQTIDDNFKTPSWQWPHARPNTYG